MRSIGVMAVVASLFGLAACDEVDFEDDGYDDRFLEGTELRDTIADETVTPAAEVQTTGEATYAGDARIDLSAETQLLGALELDVDFGDNDVAGSITNIVGDDDEAYTGQILIGGTNAIDRTATGDEPTLVATMAGTITDEGDEDLNVLGVLSGEFYGEEAYLAGDLEGTYCMAGDCSALDGDFAAAAQ